MNLCGRHRSTAHSPGYSTESSPGLIELRRAPDLAASTPISERHPRATDRRTMHTASASRNSRRARVAAALAWSASSAL